MPKLPQKDSESKAQEYYPLPPRVRRALSLIAALHQTTTAEILSGRKPKHVALARRAACVCLRDMGFSAAQSGRMLRLHHTSVLYYAPAPTGRADREIRPEEWGGAA